MKRFLLVACSLFGCSLAQEAALARPPAEASIKQVKWSKDGFTIEAGVVTPEDLIRGAALFLGRNILFSQQEVAQAGAFEFQKTLSVDAPGCELLLGQLLYMRGLVISPVDAERGVFQVINLQGPRQREIANNAPYRTTDEVLARPLDKTFVMTRVPLQYINAQIASNALRPFFASSGQQGASLMIGTVGNEKSLLVAGFNDQIAAAIRMIRESDVESSDPNSKQLHERVMMLEQQLAQLNQRLAMLEQGRAGAAGQDKK